MTQPVLQTETWHPLNSHSQVGPTSPRIAPNLSTGMLPSSGSRRVEDNWGAGDGASTGTGTSSKHATDFGIGRSTKLLVASLLLGVGVSGQTDTCVDLAVCPSIAHLCGVPNVRTRCPVMCDACPGPLPGHSNITTSPVFITLGSTVTGNTAGSPSTAGTNAASDHVYLINITRRTVIDIVRSTTWIQILQFRNSHLSVMVASWGASGR